MASIGLQHGFFWETLWNHPQNAALKELRKDPNVLLAGDAVYIPDKELKQVGGATEKRHRFQRKGVPAKLRLTLMKEDKPRANVPYVLEIDGQVFRGQTDASGLIEHSIPPDAQSGRLILDNGNEIHPLNLGNLDPIDTITGVQARLRNLGLFSGDISGELDGGTAGAISAYQLRKGLPQTGQLDQATKDKLKGDHGS